MTRKKDYFTGRQEAHKRSEVKIAPYNPRRITPKQKATLKSSIKKYGVVGGIVINKRTMTIVSGNQKISILDGILGYPENDYDILAEMVDVDEKTEKEMNFMLNSDNAKGEWDDDKVRELLKDVDWRNTGLTEEDLSLFGVDALVMTEEQSKLGEELNALLDPLKEPREQKVTSTRQEQSEQRKMIEQNQLIANQQQDIIAQQAKKEHMQQVKLDVKAKAYEKAMVDEAYVMLSFDSMDNKESFMRTFGFIETDKVIKGESLMKVAKRA